jgi:hypothetical protein
MAIHADYQEERRSRTQKTTQLLQKWRVFSGVGGAVLGPFLQRKFGPMTTAPVSVVVWAVVAGIATYAILTCVEYTYKYLFLVPAEMWSEQRERIGELDRTVKAIAERDWPASLRPETARRFADRLLGLDMRLFSIWHTPQANCTEFAALLWGIFLQGSWRAEQLQPIKVAPVQIAAGIVIHSRAVNRPELVAQIFRDVLFIEATFVNDDSPEIQVHIGPRRPALL